MAAPAATAPKTRYSLRFKLSVGLILIIGVLFAGINVFNILSNRRARRAVALTNGETIARLLAGSLVAELANASFDSETNRTFLRNVMTATITANPKNRDLAFALVINAKGEILAGRAKPNLVEFPGHKRYRDEQTVLHELAKREGRVGGFIITKRFPLKLGGSIVGKLIVGTSLAQVEREARRDLIVNVSVLVGALLVLLIYASFALGRMVIRPLGKVATALRAVQEGNLDTEVDIHSHDELGQLAHTYNFMVQGLREREKLKDAFSRYVSEKVYEKLQSGAITLTGESRNATVLFSDIRSFTTLSEQLTPAQVVAMLNEYFTDMVEIVLKYDGFVNKFIGDAIMAVYNVPVQHSHPELRAVRTAIEMIQSLGRLNAKRQQRGQFPIRIGIGVNTGPVIAGNIGHLRRLEYTVIGDTVNLAQRIESQTKVAGTQILISQSTYRAVAPYVVAQGLPPVKVKGKSEPVTLYAVTGLRSVQAKAPPPAPAAAPVQSNQP